MHRIGIEYGSTLKTKEYCAYGIPFIMAYTEKEIDKNFKYCLRIEANDDSLNIDEVLRFYNRLKTYNNVSMEMHNFAIKHYDWTVQMKKVFNY